MGRGMRAGLAALAMVSVLAGCGGEPAPAPVAPPVVEDPKRPVTGTVTLDLGRTFEGYMLTVTAVSDAAGWSAGELRDAGTDADGFLLLDFVALPPEADALVAEAANPSPAAVRRVLAFRPFTLAALQAVPGLRVRGRDGAAAVAFTPAEGEAPRRR